MSETGQYEDCEEEQYCIAEKREIDPSSPRSLTNDF